MSDNTAKLDRMIKLLANAIKNSVTTEESARISNIAARQIRKRTRLGFGIGSSGKQTKLNPLSGKYIEQREAYSENLSDQTKPRRSNLTATGQMLDSIQGGAKAGNVIVEISGSRKAGLTGSRGTASNADVARYVQEQGRPFFGVTTPERRSLIREIKQVILRRLRRG